MSKKPVVAVAMSGGVDSSVTAALLVDQGYAVFGVMLRLWSEPDSERSNRCCAPDAVALARQVASTLSIPFYVLDAKQAFYEAVVKTFIYDYTHNLTPNPCIACNRRVRWGFLLEYALAAGAEFLATGHYARLAKAADQSLQLWRAVDPLKDQSYVLYILNQAQLAHAMFPLGEYRKTEVRQLAHSYNLPVAERPDSQDLCFVGADGDYRQFLTRHAPEATCPGEIVDIEGKILGQHAGLPFYTIGQRKGLHIAAPVPLYVIDKDVANNTLIVGPHQYSMCDTFYADQVNWISDTAPISPVSGLVKIRYKAQDIPATINITEQNTIQVRLEKPVPDITPGQAAVIYNGEVCLGGGVISDRRNR